MSKKRKRKFHWRPRKAKPPPGSLAAHDEKMHKKYDPKPLKRRRCWSRDIASYWRSILRRQITSKVHSAPKTVVSVGELVWNEATRRRDEARRRKERKSFLADLRQPGFTGPEVIMDPDDKRMPWDD